MLVLVALAVLLVWQIWITSRSERRNLSLVVGGVLLVNLLFAVLHRVTLAGTGEPEYGSDPLIYWQDVLAVVEARQDTFSPYATTFKWFSALIQWTSPFNSILLTRMGNILVFGNTLVLIHGFLRRLEVTPRWSNWTVLLTGLNGIVVWTVIRHDKEPVYWFILFAFIVGLDLSMRRFKNAPILLFASMAVVTFVAHFLLDNIRVWGYFLAWIIPPTMWLFRGMFPRRLWMRSLAAAAVLIVPALLAAELASSGSGAFQTQSYVAIASRRDVDGPLDLIRVVLSLSFLIQLSIFVSGPGPLLALFGHDRFLFTTTLGNVLIFAGSLVWWFHLPRLAVLAFWRPKRETLVSMAPLLTALVVTILILVVAFGGTGDTRNRASMYVLLYPVLGLLNYRFSQLSKEQKSSTRVAVLAGTILFITMALSASILELLFTLSE